MGKTEALEMKEKFKASLGLKELPVELDKLIDFQELDSRPEYYSEGFYVGVEDRSNYHGYSSEKSFLDRLYPFAVANGSGSSYVIWDDGSARPLSQMPIVVFGDEGGYHVVAGNFLQFMRLLTYDVEISVDWDGVDFYKNDDDDDEYRHQESEDQQIYREWLKKEFLADPVSDPNEIIRPAQEKYEASFHQWMKQHGVGE